jgi:hypothetical protein
MTDYDKWQTRPLFREGAPNWQVCNFQNIISMPQMGVNTKTESVVMWLWLRIVLKTYRTTAAQVTAELNIHLQTLISTKTAQHDLYKSNIHSRAAIAKPLITETNAQMHKPWCRDHEIWTSHNWKCAHHIMVKWAVLHVVPSEGGLQSETPSSDSVTWERFCDSLDSILLVHYHPSWSNYCTVLCWKFG